MNGVQMDKQVSVVIPVFNGAAFVARAIASVLGQSRPVAEIIVVNDGSTDRTCEVLDKFGARITVINTPNRGVSRARNTGILASSGRLVAFLDADDVWHDDKVERQVACLESDPAAGLCCCDYLIDDGCQILAASHFEGLEHRLGIPVQAWCAAPLTALIRGNFLGTTSTVMVRRSVLDRVGLFNPHYKQAEDYDLWLRCAQVTGIAILSDKLMRKVGHEHNLTNNQLEMYRYHEMVLNEHATRSAFLAHVGLQEQCRLELAEIRYQIGNLFFERGHYVDSLRYYCEGLNTRYSSKNVLRFAYHASRKLARILSFGMMKNRLA
jgi:glycosyltransferase involved in cell wall biosynthesis